MERVQHFLVSRGELLFADSLQPADVYRLVDASAYDALETKAQALREEVAALRSDTNSYQSGYDEGRRMGAKHRQSEVEQLRRDLEALRARVVVPDPVQAFNKFFAESGQSKYRDTAWWNFEAGFNLARLNGKAVSEGELAALRKDKERLDAIEGNCWDVRYDSSPNADAGDSSISIEIIGHYQGAPHVRVLGENYTENLRAAIDQAMTAEAYPPERPEYDDHGRPLRAMKA